MKPKQLSFLAEYSGSIDKLLAMVDPWINRLVWRLPLDLSIEERADLAQLVRTKFARAWREKKINNWHAYLKTTVHNEYVSFLRRRKPLYQLVITDDGEPAQGRVLISLSEGMGDPLIELEQKSVLIELLDRVVEALIALPPVQKIAMVSSLQEEMDDPTLLFEAFKRRSIDLPTMTLPTDKVARQRLQVSLSHARRRMAQLLDIDLAAFKGQSTLNGRSARRSRSQDGSMCAHVTSTCLHMECVCSW
jgi:DNA-directed RNA polymerase specialized sigma24 family protein